MLRSLEDLQKYTLRTPDRELGEITDFLFDDDDWTVRYVIVRVDERDVMLSTHAFNLGGGAAGSPVEAGQENERPSFTIQADANRLLQYHGFEAGRSLPLDEEAQLSEERDFPNTMPGDLTAIPLVDMEMEKEPVVPTTGDDEADIQMNRLHSVQEVDGHRIFARDGEAGSLTDFIIDDQSWRIDYLVVDTGETGSGRRVLVSPSWIQQFDWDNSRITIDLAADTIYNSPAYDVTNGISPDYWTNLSDYYSRDDRA